MDTSFLPSVGAGFPSPSESFFEKRLNISDLLTPHPDFTYFVRVEGDSMRGAGLRSGDILVVDRTLDAINDSIVVAVLNGGFLVKRLHVEGQSIILLSEHPRYPQLTVQPSDDFVVWGVVTYCLHSVTPHTLRGRVVPSTQQPQRKQLR